MIVPDVNLLIYAYDATSPHHRAARLWWERTLSGSRTVGIPWVVVLAFVRLMTHPTLSDNPMTVGRAREIVEEWLAVPTVRLLTPGPHAFRMLFDLLENAGTGGNLCTDAMIAAHADEHGGEVHTADRDFTRFPTTRCHYPLNDPPPSSAGPAVNAPSRR